ncbi:NAD(P)/FAD-dependent oxidoreductase [Guptibacillus hwajinpoensis]|uniref:NAD(P)/FAD-dependent oxidoreductase n=1 Tax=Guptibacillus hwajinpoensis TaxID=208199 RepID=UPI001CFDDE37|nr:FAD-dependent oxidoreductase [Pseudalkalibacillus hwajinpoensis]WLR57877.1 FAD-dependent oxidoreductase [Pseudalkalibacillus hwajinpoensis]
MRKVDVAIVGGGIAGTLAARKLTEDGINVLVLDKSKSVGGRLATRRIGDGRADHGAQFFTVRTDQFQQFVDEWEQNQWISRWFGDKHARYKATNGMNQLVKNLASGVPHQLNSKVERIERAEEEYVVISEEGERVQASLVILTPPAPQTLQLLEASDVQLSDQSLQSLNQITFDPAIVGLLTLKKEEETRLPPEGHKDSDLPDGIERVVDNREKGISDERIITVYGTPDFSKSFYHHEDEAVLSEMLKKIDHLLPLESLVSQQLKRWRYAQAVHVHNHPFLNVSDKEAIFVAGDAFLHENDQAGRTRIESAVLSGVAVAEEIKQLVKRKTST